MKAPVVQITTLSLSLLIGLVAIAPSTARPTIPTSSDVDHVVQLSEEFVPTDRGIPERREGGGTR